MSFEKNDKEKNKISDQCTPKQLELLDLIVFNGTADLAENFMLIHDIALYHSDYTIDENVKTALYELKQVSLILAEISKEN